MAGDASDKALTELAWKHIGADEYDKAETIVRQRIAIAAPEDCRFRCELFGLLASILNSLSRHAKPPQCCAKRWGTRLRSDQSLKTPTAAAGRGSDAADSRR